MGSHHHFGREGPEGVDGKEEGSGKEAVSMLAEAGGGQGSGKQASLLLTTSAVSMLAACQGAIDTHGFIDEFA